MQATEIKNLKRMKKKKKGAKNQNRFTKHYEKCGADKRKSKLFIRNNSEF